MKTSYSNLGLHEKINLKHNFGFAQLQRNKHYQIVRPYGAAQYMRKMNSTYKMLNADIEVSNEKHESMFVHRGFGHTLTH